MDPIWRKNWPEGLPYTQNYPEVPVWSLLEGMAGRYPERPCIIFRETAYSYARMWELAEKCSTALYSLGVEKGDRVAMHLPNCPETAIAYYGLLRAGAVYTPCNQTLSAKELTNQLNDSGARAIFTTDAMAPLVRQIKEHTRLENIIVVATQEVMNRVRSGDFSSLEAGWHSFSRLIGGASPNPPRISINPREDLAHLAYTGGTTGVSKGCMITHFNALTNCLQSAAWYAGGVVELENGFPLIRKLGERPGSDQWEYPFTNGEGVTVAVSPLSHAMGMGHLNRNMSVGSTVVLHQRLNNRAFLQDIEKYGVTFFGGAPSMFIKLLSTPGIEKMNLSSVRSIVSGSSPLPVELIEGIKKTFINAVLVEGYGLSESTTTATTNPCGRHGQQKAGTVGPPLFDTEIKIMDNEEGKIQLPPGEAGEICIRGPQVMKGYYNRPEATAEALRDGWLYTGDIGRFDEDGYLTILDRKKDMLLYKGYNVYPRELEELLFEHPAVLTCSVIGKRDPEAGEIPKAFVVLAEGRRVSKNELMDFVNERVTPYKKLRELEFIEALPMSAVGKVLKRALRERG